ncbi:hypothetical protein COU15_01200 [Candidatus Kaiserbacteria bacterium CG10_big_fil_rev_8_21_14_0_10_45_20]|uniref:N-acetyltransferase domain-containing protein n=1 Tax=Candidatus Kaiserbacteria bacterium CG10_big_fil_rev_8_21_14_0_10_45_20 TaxID=1974607 RepID=A0A2H0UFY7_9BACT|nr:MAG: hypothetical protein COU15_01200 [Candidatus Kaiserbacteria bacterium CG10_big_fil_rev_8_21_14_0_10_45_20]
MNVESQNTKPSYEVFRKKVDGKEVGFIEIERTDTTPPYIYVAGLSVSEDFRSGGVASTLLEKVEKIIKKENKIGFLVNAISGPGYALYQKRGWRQVENAAELYVYNVPAHLSDKELSRLFYSA